MGKKTPIAKCQHSSLYCDSPPNPQDGGFARPTPQKRLAAATRSGRLTTSLQAAIDQTVFNDDEYFPGPLVLPDDALAIDPKEPPQSFKSWLMTVDGQGNRVTSKRKTLYIIPPPGASDDIGPLMKDWAKPQVEKGHRTPDVPAATTKPDVSDLRDYLAAFYHPMPVKVLDSGYRWVPWDTSPGTSKGETKRIGLQTPPPNQEIIGIAYRPSPDGVARQQLNLNDIMDAMISRVPSDAHAIVMLTHEDLFEDDEDDFCCGRAYGGSRIAIVSSFRYNPSMDRYSDIDIDHCWPASHCKAYVDELCYDSAPPTKRVKADTPPMVSRDESCPLAAAVRAADPVMAPRTVEDYSGLWMSRVARTISHEVGHCLTLGHCVYFACVMQGTASVAEDNRQPPYLCPVCTEKLSYNLIPLMGKGKTNGDIQRSWVEGQHHAMLDFCRKWPRVALFAGLEAWMLARFGATPSKASGLEEVTKNGKTVNVSSKQFAQWLEDD